jgi:hypothetical protein
MRGVSLGVAATALGAFACVKRPPASTPTPREAAVAISDGAAILHAAWKVATAGGHSGRALWFWAPASQDTSRALPISTALRAALVQLQVPASERRPIGDDTVVFRVTRWQPDSAGVLVGLYSAWTTVLGTGARRCRTGSGNSEQFRVRLENGEWRAERVGPVAHGDNICVPLPSGSTG